jgi:hypothetical protein
VYEVSLDGRPLAADYTSYKTGVIQRRDGNYYQYWFVPIGAPDVGEHRIDYKVTWRQQVSDGFKTFGPDGEVESETGSCVFTVR